MNGCEVIQMDTIKNEDVSEYMGEGRLVKNMMNGDLGGRPRYGISKVVECL